jgi:hypothetical protein
VNPKKKHQFDRTLSNTLLHPCHSFIILHLNLFNAKKNDRVSFEEKVGYLKCKVTSIAVLNAFFSRFDPEDRNHGSKGLLPRNSHIWAHVVDEEWPYKVSFSFPFLCGMSSYLELKSRIKHHLKVDRDHGIPSAGKFNSLSSMIKLNVDEPLKFGASLQCSLSSSLSIRSTDHVMWVQTKDSNNSEVNSF